MINEISKVDRLTGMHNRILLNSSNDKDIKILNKVDKFLESYCKYSKIMPHEVVSIVNKFHKRYLDDVKKYKNTGKYPYELNEYKSTFNLTREEYDIVLICSVMTSKHRLQIISSINSISAVNQQVAMIGIGSGVELLFVNSKNIDAYDLSISNFVNAKFNSINLYESEFKSNKDKYDLIFAIEILEHLSNPFLLLNEIHSSLKTRGRCVLTVTTNVPQFDHLYDFKIEGFIEKLNEIGFVIVKSNKFKHKYDFQKIDPFNTFFIIEKIDL